MTEKTTIGIDDIYLKMLQEEFAIVKSQLELLLGKTLSNTTFRRVLYGGKIIKKVHLDNSSYWYKDTLLVEFKDKSVSMDSKHYKVTQTVVLPNLDKEDE